MRISPISMLPSPEIKLRFVRNIGWKYTVVAWRSGICMPFCPTHVEAVTPQGTWLGMHGHPHHGLPAGLQDQPAEYDHDEVYVMAGGRRCELFVSLPCTQEQADLFYASMRKPEPYDWWAPWGFLLGGHWHKIFTAMCSPKVIMCLRTARVFPWRITKPFHEITPADLLLILSTHIEIPH
jgi:hypothetical protein